VRQLRRVILIERNADAPVVAHGSTIATRRVTPHRHRRRSPADHLPDALDPHPATLRYALTGRISHRMRARFNSPWHLGLRAWSAAVLSLSGGGVDGHVDAEGSELAEVAADLAVAACLLVVPAGAEVGEPGRGSARR
jgi:hypothetical protein